MKNIQSFLLGISLIVIIGLITSGTLSNGSVLVVKPQTPKVSYTFVSENKEDCVRRMNFFTKQQFIVKNVATTSGQYRDSYYIIVTVEKY